MSKADEAVEILRELGMPSKQQNERSALTLLALAHIEPAGDWKDAEQPLLRILDIMSFMHERYGKEYAPNSRETIRRETIHQFEQARIVDRNPDDPSRPTNSGKTCYALTEEVLKVIRAHGTSQFGKRLRTFTKKFGKLQTACKKERKLHKVPLQLSDGREYSLSPGDHNELQAAIIREFGPRFARDATVLYVGDTAVKHLVCEQKAFASFRIEVTEHDKLPDIVLFDAKKKWLFLVEAVTTHGPVGPKRHSEIEEMMQNCPADRIYVTAFPDRATFRKYCVDIAWETEVWIADHPDHLIHFNGDKFLGPHKHPN